MKKLILVAAVSLIAATGANAAYNTFAQKPYISDIM